MGRGGEREGEKHQCVVVLMCPLLGKPGLQPKAGALTGNRTGDPLFHRPAHNPLSHISQDPVLVF